MAVDKKPISLAELQRAVDVAASSHYRSPEEVAVLITLDQPSMGPRASVGVYHAGLGFDWEDGQFRLAPAERLVLSRKDRDIALEPGKHLSGGIRVTCCCRCGQRVAKTDVYCRHCGQRLKATRSSAAPCYKCSNKTECHLGRWPFIPGDGGVCVNFKVKEKTDGEV